MGEENKTGIVSKTQESAPPISQNTAAQKFTPSLSPKRLALFTVAGILAILLISAIGYVYWRSQANNDEEATTALSSGWQQYENKQLNMKFMYPDSWGKPELSKKIKPSGTSYTISFNSSTIDKTKVKKLNTSVSLFFETNGLVKTVCQNETVESCSKTHGLEASDIYEQLQDTSSFVESDDSSFARIDNSGKGFSVLEVNQIVNLPKINVSAVSAKYFINQTPDTVGCPAGKFSNNDQTLCITKPIYVDINRFLKSISTV